MLQRLVFASNYSEILYNSWSFLPELSVCVCIYIFAVNLQVLPLNWVGLYLWINEPIQNITIIPAMPSEHGSYLIRLRRSQIWSATEICNMINWVASQPAGYSVPMVGIWYVQNPAHGIHQCSLAILHGQSFNQHNYYLARLDGNYNTFPSEEWSST